MPDPRGTVDPGTGNRATARRGTHGSEAIIRDIADQITGRGEPDPPEVSSSGQFSKIWQPYRGTSCFRPPGRGRSGRVATLTRRTSRILRQERLHFLDLMSC
jgi:hypothetical protein